MGLSRTNSVFEKSDRVLYESSIAMIYTCDLPFTDAKTLGRT